MHYYLYNHAYKNYKTFFHQFELFKLGKGLGFYVEEVDPV